MFSIKIECLTRSKHTPIIMSNPAALYTINEGCLYILHHGALDGFIINKDQVVTFDTSKLARINKNHDKYDLVCSYIISALTDNISIIRYDDISNIIDCFMHVIRKGYPINYELSLRKSVLFRDEMFNDNNGAKMELYVDIYNVLTLARYDHDKTWYFIKYYIRLIGREQLGASSKVVDTIIRSVICLADLRPNDNIGTLIDILRGEGVPFDIYYYLIFDIYTVADPKITGIDYVYSSYTYNYSFNKFYGKTASRLIELGISKNIKLDNIAIEFINGSWYNPLESGNIHLSTVTDLLIEVLLITSAPDKGNEKKLINLLRYEYGCSESYSKEFTRNILCSLYTKDEIINRLIDIIRRQYTFKDCLMFRSTKLNIHPAHIESFGFLLGMQEDEFRRGLLDSNDNILRAIYHGLAVGFRLQIPINDNTIYLYKRLTPLNIQNYKEWCDIRAADIKTGNRAKIGYIARSKIDESPNNRANVNFASLGDLVYSYL